MNAATMPHPSGPVKRMNRKRLLFVRQRFSSVGGGELILDRTMAALKERSFDVALLGRSWSGGRGVEFIACNPSRVPRFLRERKFATAACDRLARENDALVQSHERMPCCDIFRAGDGVHAAFIEHRKRGMSALAGSVFSLHPFHRSVMALEREMFASPRLKTVIANSQMVADEVVRHFNFAREKIHLVPNGIDLARFHPDARARFRTGTRRQLGTDERCPVALFVGSGFKRKGLDASIAALAKSGAGAELWVIGHDRRPSAYRRLAERSGVNLRLVGPVNDPLPYYASADILLLPSIYDPFPSTAIEALACGLPVVTSTSCGAKEAVAKLDASLVRDAYDVAGLADAATRALALAGDSQTVDRARAIANDYDMDAMIDRLLRLYASLGFGKETRPS
jgi:UDP-glucose:(heptosyl)LPS alpha-1,3-glucosyltransferase